MAVYTDVSDDDIADLRAIQESTMIDSCTISDPRHKTGAQGQEWVARGSAVACGVSSLSQAIQTGQLSIIPDLPATERAFVVALPITAAPIKQGARIGMRSRHVLRRELEVARDFREFGELFRHSEIGCDNRNEARAC